MKTNVFVLISVMLCGTLTSTGQKAFQYVESSTGMNYPDWESGKTELEFADINSDGYVDILSIGDHGCPGWGGQSGIMVWFGNGSGSWNAQVYGDFGYGGIAIGDVNNDGFWDVGYGMHHDYSSTDLGDQMMEVALGDGTGTGWTAWDNGLATNGESWGMFGTDFADVNNDGFLDIGSNSFGSGGGVHVYLNQGDGSWVQGFGFLNGNSNMRFVFGDINNDGNADFVASHEYGIAWFGNGDGTFINASYNLPSYSFPITGPDLKDVNKDGGKDLSYINPNGGVMVWSFDNESGLWVDISADLPQSGNYEESQLCDFNSDETMDVAAFGQALLTIWTGTVSETGVVSWNQEFSAVTSNNGDCGAFRAGGDVDRNGFPDITLVEKVGSWPNDYNEMKCFRENTQIFLYHIKSVYPIGNEVFKQGSVQFIDWVSAVPASSKSTVKIEYSLRGLYGDYHTVTPVATNSGRFQWTLPYTISSNNCFLKYTLIEDDDTLVATHPKAFTILGSNGLDPEFTSDSTMVLPGSEISFFDLSLGLITGWEWDFDNNGTVDSYDRNPVYEYQQPGKYSVSLKVTDGINSLSVVKEDYITVLDYTHIEEWQDIFYDFQIFPNPASSLIYLVNNANVVHKPYSRLNIRIFDSKGNLLLQLQGVKMPDAGRALEIGLEGFLSGQYFILIENNDIKLLRKLIIM